MHGRSRSRSQSVQERRFHGQRGSERNQGRQTRFVTLSSQLVHSRGNSFCTSIQGLLYLKIPLNIIISGNKLQPKTNHIQSTAVQREEMLAFRTQVLDEPTCVFTFHLPTSPGRLAASHQKTPQLGSVCLKPHLSPSALGNQKHLLQRMQLKLGTLQNELVAAKKRKFCDTTSAKRSISNSQMSTVERLPVPVRHSTPDGRLWLQEPSQQLRTRPPPSVLPSVLHWGGLHHNLMAPHPLPLASALIKSVYVVLPPASQNYSFPVEEALCYWTTPLLPRQPEPTCRQLDAIDVHYAYRRCWEVQHGE